MNVSPKISVIMPVYNTEKFLIKCLDSIINQTYKNFELICIDDKSIDNSLSILQEFAKQYKNIKIIKNSTNQGQSYCKNIALNIADGDYISFVDSDDFISVNFLEEMICAAVKQNTDIVITDMAFENKKTHDYDLIRHDKKCCCELLKKLSILDNGSCCNKIFSSKLIKKYQINFPNGVLYEDNEFLLKATYWANKICVINECTYYVHCNENSTVRNRNNNTKLKKSASIIFNHIVEFFSSKNLTQQEQEKLIKFCIESFCNIYITDEKFLLSINLSKNDIPRKYILPRYKNVFQRLFSLLNISETIKVLTIFFVPVLLKRRKNRG